MSFPGSGMGYCDGTVYTSVSGYFKMGDVRMRSMSGRSVGTKYSCFLRADETGIALAEASLSQKGF